MKYGGTEAATNEMATDAHEEREQLRAEQILLDLVSVVFGFAACDRGREARRLGVPDAPYPSPASAPTTTSTAGLDATGRSRRCAISS